MIWFALWALWGPQLCWANSIMCSLPHHSSFGAIFDFLTFSWDGTSLISFPFPLAGVGLVTRKMGNSLSPTVEVTLEGDTYTLTTTSTFKTSAISFKLGVEFDEETLDGRNVKSIITLDGNKLTQEQKGDKPTTIVREFTALRATLPTTICSLRRSDSFWPDPLSGSTLNTCHSLGRCCARLRSALFVGALQCSWWALHYTRLFATLFISLFHSTTLDLFCLWVICLVFSETSDKQVNLYFPRFARHFAVVTNV